MDTVPVDHGVPAFVQTEIVVTGFCPAFALTYRDFQAVNLNVLRRLFLRRVRPTLPTAINPGDRPPARVSPRLTDRARPAESGCPAPADKRRDTARRRYSRYDRHGHNSG